jgi:hypothetical protein
MKEYQSMDARESVSATKHKLGAKVTQVATLYNPRTWKEKGLWWTLGLFTVTYVAAVVILGIIWSRSPAQFDVREHALKLAKGDESKLVPGYVTTATTIRIAETLLNKPGGYLSNDMTPPGVYLDNIPNWEFGALTQLRDLARAMRNDFGRSQSLSVEDKDLQIAEPQFNYNSESWILPSTESEYRKGVNALYRYLERLVDQDTQDGQFFARSDNLSRYLEVVEKRLGSLAQRLAASLGQAQFDTALAGDPSAEQAKPTLLMRPGTRPRG